MKNFYQKSKKGNGYGITSKILALLISLAIFGSAAVTAYAVEDDGTGPQNPPETTSVVDEITEETNDGTEEENEETKENLPDETKTDDEEEDEDDEEEIAMAAFGLAGTFGVYTPVTFAELPAALAAAEAGDAFILSDGEGSVLPMAANIVFPVSVTVNFNNTTVELAHTVNFDVAEGASVTLENGSLVRASVQTGRSRAISAPGAGDTLTLVNMNVSGFYMKGDIGGAIFTNGNVVLQNCNFSNNIATREYTGDGGGAVYAGGSVVVEGGSFIGNKAIWEVGVSGAFGGAIHAVGGITVSSATFSGGQADFGGAIYTGGNAVLSGVTITDCHAPKSRNDVNAGKGGGLYAAGTIEITDSSSFTLNTSPEGGAIYGKSKVTISDSIIEGNTATVNGGGICAEGDLTLTGTTIKGNKNTNTQAGIQGTAGIYAGANVTITGGSITGNYSERGTGGAGLYANSYTHTVTITGTSITGNSVKNSNLGGGGVLASGPLTLTNVTLENNHVGGYGSGGGAYAYNDLTVEGGTVTKNTALDGSGGGLASRKNTIINGTTIKQNEANAGGALRVQNGGLTITGASITENKAAFAGALELYMYNDGFTIKNTDISKNTSTGNAGAIYALLDGTASSKIAGKIEGCTIKGNHSPYTGGAIWAQPYYGDPNSFGELYITDSDIGGDAPADGNKGAWGGAIYTNENLTLQVDGSSRIVGNTAQEGGAIFCRGELIVKDTAEISGNTAKGVDDDLGYGGGIFISGTSNTAVVTGKASISNNTATSADKSGFGGGIYTNGKSLTLSGNATLSENYASFDGGGLYAYTQSAVTVTDSAVITGNEAGYWGGAIYAESDTTTLTINGNKTGGDGVVISGNTAGEKGGAIFVKNSTKADISGAVQFLNNTATKEEGGAIFTGDYAALSVGSGVIFSGNRAPVAYNIKDETDINTYNAQIGSLVLDAPFKYGYNNYDINYISTYLFASYVVETATRVVNIPPGTVATGGTIEASFSSTDADGKVFEGATVKLKAEAAPGYGFVGWKVEPKISPLSRNSGIIVTSAEGSFTMPGYDVVVTAEFKEIADIEVTFEGGAGTLTGDAAQTLEKGATLTEAPTAEQDNHVFRGWFTEEDGQGTKLALPVVLYADTTYYAYYVPLYTVTFDRNGGDEDSDPASITVPGDEGLESLPVPPVKKGSIFEGWNLEPDGDGEPFNTQYELTGDITVYAQWNKINFTLTFDANGGINPPAHQVLQMDDKAAAPTTLPTCEGHFLVGWNTARDGSGQDWNFDEDVMPDANVVLFAQWRMDTVIVPDPDPSSSDSTSDSTSNSDGTSSSTSNGTGGPQNSTPDGSKSPATGDNISVVLWGMLLLLSLAAAAAIIIMRTRGCYTKKQSKK